VRHEKRQRQRYKNRQKCRDRDRVRETGKRNIVIESKTEKYRNRDGETGKETEM